MDQLLDKAIETASRVETTVRALRGHANNPSAEGYTAAGRINEYANHPVSAMLCYKAALQVDAHAHEAKARLAIVQLKAHLNDEALTTMTELFYEEPNFKFLSLDGSPTCAMTVLADVLRACGRPDALATYGKALEVEPRDGYAAGCYAELLVSAGRLQDAMALAKSVPESDNFAALRSTLRLGGNESRLLPALVGVSHSAFAVGKNV